MPQSFISYISLYIFSITFIHTLLFILWFSFISLICFSFPFYPLRFPSIPLDVSLYTCSVSINISYVTLYYLRFTSISVIRSLEYTSCFYQYFIRPSISIMSCIHISYTAHNIIHVYRQYFYTTLPLFPLLLASIQ